MRLKNDLREYAISNATSYSGQSFEILKNCFSVSVYVNIYKQQMCARLIVLHCRKRGDRKSSRNILKIVNVDVKHQCILTKLFQSGLHNEAISATPWFPSERTMTRCDDARARARRVYKARVPEVVLMS